MHPSSRVFVGLFILLAASRVVALEPKPESRIVDGASVPISQFPTVAEVGDTSGTTCTGTLISPRHVLCAGHCVTDDNGVLNWGKTNGRIKLGGQTYSTSDIIVHPSYNGGLEVEGVLDLAILVLDQPVPGIAPTPLYRKAPAVGVHLTLAGFGATGTGAAGVDDNSPFPAAGTLHFGTTPIDEVSATFIKWNFDNVPGANKESNTAPGDSGGPAFITENGINYIAGVTSGGRSDNAGFGDVSFDTRVDIAAAWIDSIAGTSSTPTLAITVSAASEIGPEDGIFTFTRSGGDNAAALAIAFTVSGTATSGTDYKAIGTSVSIPAGAATVTVRVTPLTDTVTEGTETVILTPTAPAGYTLSSTSATVKILETALIKITSGPTANPSPGAAREPVTFTCAASLTGATIAWNFGDGSTGTGATTTHSYATVGTFTVTATATDAAGDSKDSKTIALTINGFASLVEASVSRVRANLNFRNPVADKLEFRVSSPDFVYRDRLDFLDAVDGTTVEVYLGTTRIDTVEIFNTRGFGDGTLMWNARKGELTYKLKSEEVESLLSKYGAVNGDTVTTLSLPLYIKVGKNAYGSIVSVGYKAKIDRTGMAK